MEFNMDKVGTIELDAAFFKEHKFEITAHCMRLEPNTDGMTENVRLDTRIKALNTVAEKHGYGPFAHICDTCTKDDNCCDADSGEDIMYGWGTEGDNVCFCNKFTLKEG